MDTVIAFGAFVGIGLLIMAVVLALLEKVQDKLVVYDGRVRRASSVRQEQIRETNERIDQVRKRLEHPGFLGWNEDWE